MATIFTCKSLLRKGKLAKFLKVKMYDSKLPVNWFWATISSKKKEKLRLPLTVSKLARPCKMMSWRQVLSSSSSTSEEQGLTCRSWKKMTMRQSITLPRAKTTKRTRAHLQQVRKTLWLLHCPFRCSNYQKSNNKLCCTSKLTTIRSPKIWKRLFKAWIK